MSDLTISFGRVTDQMGSLVWGTQRQVPHEPPMYWAYRGTSKPISPALWHYAYTPWNVIFHALKSERRPLPLRDLFA